MAIPTLSEIVEGVKNGINSLLQPVRDAVSSVSSGVTNGIVNLYNAINSRLNSVTSDISSNISSTVGGLLSGVTGSLSNITSQLNSLISSGLGSAGSLANDIVEYIQSYISPLSNHVNNIGNWIQTNLTTIYDNLRGSIGNISNAVSSSVNSAISGLSNLISSGYNSVTGILQNALSGLSSTFNGAVSGIVDRISNIGSTISNSVFSVVDSVRNSVSSAVGAVSNNVSALVSSVTSGIQSFANSISDTIQNSIATVRQWIDSAASAISSVLVIIAGAIQTGVAQLLAFFRDFVWPFLSQIGSLLADTLIYFKDEIQERVNTTKSDKSRVDRGISNALSRLLSGDREAAYEIIQLFDPSAHDSWIMSFIGAAIIAIPAAMTVINASLTGVGELVEQESLLKYKPGLLEPDVLVRAVIRGFLSEDQAISEINRQGFTDSKWAVLKQVARPILGVGEILNAYLLGYISENDAKRKLELVGYLTEDANLLIANTKRTLSESVIGELYRRGQLSSAEAISELGKLGYDRDYAIQFLSTQLRLLGIEDIRELFLRGLISPEEHDRLLAEHGFTPDQIAKVKNLYYILPTPSDLIRMAVREVFSPEVAEKFGHFSDYPEEFSRYAKQLGISEEWAKRYWAAHWDLPSASQGFSMFHRDIISREELELLLRSLDVLPFWRDKLIQLAYNPLPRVDVRRMYDLGILDREGVKRAYLDLGYSPEHAEGLTEFTVRYYSDDTTNEYLEIRSLTRSVVESAYDRRLITREEALDRLTQLGYAPEDAQLLLSIIDYNREIRLNPLKEGELQARAEGIILDAYTRRLLSEGEAIEQLQAIGYSQLEAQTALSLQDYEYELKIKNLIASRASQAYSERTISEVELANILGEAGFTGKEIGAILTEASIERQYRVRKPSYTQIRNLYRAGIITKQEAIEELKGLGYNDKYIEWLFQLEFEE